MKQAQTEDEQEPEDDSDDDEPELCGLDSEWLSPTNDERWIDDVRDIEPASIKRSTTAATITGVLPDGITERSFDYISHEVSERPEYKLIFDINTSMANVRRRCSVAGVLFPEHRHGDTPTPLTINSSHLRCIHVSEWDLMSDLERVKLWSTGVDLFILGMTGIPQTGNIRAQMTKNHRMDAPVQVQVQGLRIIPDEDSNASADYTKSIGTTTLREVLNHGERPDGLVLNALNLPSGHMAHWNPLLGTGFDLEHMAYRQTNGLKGFVHKDPAYKEMYWQLLGLAHAFSLLHLDISATWVFVWGPGEKFWIRGRSRTGEDITVPVPTRDIGHSNAFDDWQPDKASTDTCDYEVVVLPAGAGVLLQQPGREHAVISTNTGDNASPSIDRTATWTVGGYFFCASSIRPAMCMTLHMVMFQHLLTNADHVAMWQMFIRVNMFWLHVTAGRLPEDLQALAAYCPDLSNAEGWMDIIYLSCMIVLLPALDVRNYARKGPSEAALEDAAEADIVRAYYKTWRHWLATKYMCSYAGEHTDWDMEWEADVFSPCLLHLAWTLQEYHLQQSTKYPDVEIFKIFTPEALTSRLCDALGAYNKKVLNKFKLKKVGVKLSVEDATKFFLLDASKLTLVPR
ncbi:hypothetical protein DFH06DRAFT_753711 [Mycena polygramma]|nr:hypothetical protein DFH06DRAFT_753711 [Mycena polygramma]